jgi:nucleotide-binding universal stress UspA family protein
MSEAPSVILMARTLEYRRILVPIGGNPESEKAMDVACRIAAARVGMITAVAVVEVPQLLPFDAHMVEEEGKAHRLLQRAGSIADSYGFASPRTLSGRARLPVRSFAKPRRQKLKSSLSAHHEGAAQARVRSAARSSMC